MIKTSGAPSSQSRIRIIFRLLLYIRVVRSDVTVVRPKPVLRVR
jgi:hypothetical protein